MNHTYSLTSTTTLFHADCREALRALPDNCLDSCCTDPPYALVSIVKRFGGANAAPAKGNDAYMRASAGFMGKTWDTGETAMSAEFWAEVLRVLKPGAHLAAFGASRGYHRMACAIEDAGFEIRDSLLDLVNPDDPIAQFMDTLNDAQRDAFVRAVDHVSPGGPLAWLYGTGFPKSHDVAKNIDKAGGISPRDQAVVLRGRREAAGMSRDDLASAVGCTVSSVRDWEEGRARSAGGALEWMVPSDEYRVKLADTLGYTADERRIVGVSLDRRGDETVIGLGHSGELRTGGHTAAAAEWEGWGTALKPAFEPIVLARKPLSEGTVAANVLRWRTGALNIDACRVETDAPRPNRERRKDESLDATRNTFGSGLNGSRAVEDTTQGRWPANVVTDGSAEVVEAFPRQAGAAAPVRGTEASAASNGDVTGKRARVAGAFHGDSGSAARFFYSSKAGRSDRVDRWYEDVRIEWTSAQGQCQVSLLVDTEPLPGKVIGVSGSGDVNAWNTFLFGSTITDLFRTGCRSITRTKTSSTTESRIWNYLMLLPTSESTADASSVTVSGSSLAADAGKSDQSITIMNERTVCLPGASLALSKTPLRISGFGKRGGHPTVKPIALMQWLARLITPPGGVVLDPFAGSGTTGAACAAEGFKCILVEREAEYVADICRRFESPSLVPQDNS